MQISERPSVYLAARRRPPTHGPVRAAAKEGKKDTVESESESAVSGELKITRKDSKRETGGKKDKRSKKIKESTTESEAEKGDTKKSSIKDKKGSKEDKGSEAESGEEKDYRGKIQKKKREVQRRTRS